MTERRRLEEELSYRAFHDPLTGLPNRSLFVDRLENALSWAGSRHGPVCVAFMDLDDFKAVNVRADTRPETSYSSRSPLVCAGA